MFVAHPQHPLRRPQVMDGVIGHELGDHLLAPRPGVGAPPSWSARPAHGEGDLLLRVVGPDSANHTPTHHNPPSRSNSCLSAENLARCYFAAHRRCRVSDLRHAEGSNPSATANLCRPVCAVSGAVVLGLRWGGLALNGVLADETVWDRVVYGRGGWAPSAVPGR